LIRTSRLSSISPLLNLWYDISLINRSSTKIQYDLVTIILYKSSYNLFAIGIIKNMGRSLLFEIASTYHVHIQVWGSLQPPCRNPISLQSLVHKMGLQICRIACCPTGANFKKLSSFTNCVSSTSSSKIYKKKEKKRHYSKTKLLEYITI